MAAHAYWRIYITANNGDASYAGGVEIEMLDVVGGTDLCSGGTAIGSSGYYSVSNAFDNSTSSIFAQDFGTSQANIGYQFSNPVDLIQFTFTCEAAGFTSRAPKDFQLQYSDDGSTWTTSRSFTNETSWSSLEKRTFYAYSLTLAGNITESMAITDWLVAVYASRNMILLGTATVTGSSYSIGNLQPNPCSITISPKINGSWSKNTEIALDYYVVPTAPDTTPRLYKCTTAGTTHATTEPTWPSSGTVTDGTVVWTFIADLDDGLFKTYGAKIPS